jgi:hypothetical protein
MVNKNEGSQVPLAPGALRFRGVGLPQSSVCQEPHAVPAHVNLDALIKREDFEVVAEGDAPTKSSIEIRELERDGFFFAGLRKPDFQRETSEWDPKRVVGLIRTFLEEDLIPAVILWKNRDLYFVIDGSHRLSALIAWVQDDYGSGDTSQAFWQHSIPEEQTTIAQQTKELVEKEFGSYKSHRDAIANPNAYGPAIVSRARRLATISLNLQWVKGDSTKAEHSFVRINQQAANITPQELELIKNRKLPNAIAARAILQRGTGHQYWSPFSEEKQELIKELATTVFDLLFEPFLRYPIKSLDLPAGGAVYSSTSLRMVYDFVNLCSGVPDNHADTTGQKTIDHLARCRRVARLIISNDSSSLGLHPAVYFYSWTGKQQPILFLTWTQIVIILEQSKILDHFIRVRSQLEKFLINNRPLVNQVIRKFGTKSSGSSHLVEFYRDVLDFFERSGSDDDILSSFKDNVKYRYLQPDESPYSGVSPTRFSTQVKSGLVVHTLLPSAPRCPICNGLVPMQAISIDHKVRKENGGPSTVENAQVTHPYCNTGFKEKATHAQRAGL